MLVFEKLLVATLTNSRQQISLGNASNILEQQYGKALRVLNCIMLAFVAYIDLEFSLYLDLLGSLLESCYSAV